MYTSFSTLVRYGALDVHYRRADVCSTTLGRESISDVVIEHCTCVVESGTVVRRSQGYRLGSSNVSSNSNSWRWRTCYQTHGRKIPKRGPTPIRCHDDSSVAHLLRRSPCGWRDSRGWPRFCRRNTPPKPPRCGPTNRPSFARPGISKAPRGCMAYGRLYRREALARKDLNWSVVNSRLYSEAFTGRAKVIPRCRYCLSALLKKRCYRNTLRGVRMDI